MALRGVEGKKLSLADAVAYFLIWHVLAVVMPMAPHRAMIFRRRALLACPTDGDGCSITGFDGDRRRGRHAAQFISACGISPSSMGSGASVAVERQPDVIRHTGWPDGRDKPPLS